ncbi:hypothetical protein HLB44_21780 [Aquincola sp. S2]|uniref:Uncharacterized protein n=1 Tax=Pseudaquabacterium terrae TaxID=2732868 RepID=A0ABX2EM15_9BURK|nr:hypothetical protein [Aquabacterium terrae]NRF69638.1 hypothetical protein [Aquabacterium terrae]
MRTAERGIPLSPCRSNGESTWKQSRGTAIRAVAIAAVAFAASAADAQAPRGAVPRSAASPTNEAQLVIPQTLFDWAQKAHYALFPGWGSWSRVYNSHYYFRTPETTTLDSYSYRYYSSTKNYVGMAGDDVYIAGPVGGGTVQWVGKAADFACQINPNACASNGPEDGPMFVLDGNTNQIYVLRHKAPRAGTVVVGSSASPAPNSGLTEQGFGSHMAYDGRNDRLFVAARGGLWVFDQAKNMSGSVTPTRTIKVEGLDWGWHIVYDAARDMIYLLGVNAQSEGRLAVLNNVSTIGGLVTADRMLTIDRQINTFTVDLSRSIGYFSFGSGVIVVTNIDAIRSGALPTTRSFSLGSEASHRGLAVDARRDRLYIGDNGLQSGVHIVTNASTAAASNVASELVAVPGAWGVTFDAANDRLYVNSGGSQLTLLPGASGLRRGALPKTAVVLTGAYATELSAVAVP